MKVNRTLASVLFSFCAFSVFLISCSKDDPKPNAGKLTGTVTDIETSAALPDVLIIVFNADDNSPTGTTLLTDADGKFEKNLAPGNYFLKFSKQGYEPQPPPTIEAIPFTISKGQITDQSAEMSASSATNTGFISGKVSAPEGLGGVLVVAEDNSNERGFSTVSADDGTYVIYNVPAGSYTMKGYIAGYTSGTAFAAVTANTESPDVNITLSTGATGELSGTVRNLATENKDVDISLVHPLTKETIPGLTTTSSALSFTIGEIPDGVYIARATYKNDERVMDPDRIAKFGEPIVEFSGNDSQEITFDITGSVQLVSPTNESTTNIPTEINSTTPTFTWTAYSSTSDYVIEVIDASSGEVIWGGFDKSGALPEKNIVIPSSQKTIQFNADGNASIPALVVGNIYRWRVFASKNDQNSTTGWTLISASEDQLGLIKIVE